jgi:hypothetical protein
MTSMANVLDILHHSKYFQKQQFRNCISGGKMQKEETYSTETARQTHSQSKEMLYLKNWR